MQLNAASINSPHNTPKIYSFIIEKANEKMKKKGKFQKYVTYYKAKGSQQYQREPFVKIC